MASWVIHTTNSCPSLSLPPDWWTVPASAGLSPACPILFENSQGLFLHRNLREQGIYTYLLHWHSGSHAYIFPAKQWNRNKKTQPICISVSWHAELCLTSCEHGKLLSHVLQKAEVAGIVKKTNYSIVERKHLSARGVQVYNHHMKGESAVIVNGNT